MNLADLQRIANGVQDTVSAYRSRANDRIVQSIDKAHAHGVLALTDRLKTATPGRRTLQIAKRGQSYNAACSDLNQLWDRLCGPSIAALDGMLRDARATTYVVACRLVAASFDPQHHKDGGKFYQPSQARLDAARSLVVNGYDLRSLIGGRIKPIAAGLLATLDRASKPGVVDGTALDLIADWAETSTTSLRNAVQSALSDSAIALTSKAMVDEMHPDYHPRDGIAPE